LTESRKAWRSWFK